MTEAERERAEIVAWLLGPARIDYDASGSEEHFSWWAADAIEALAHKDAGNADPA